MGGHKANPTYNQVCDGDTGHAEVVQIRYDADVVSFGDLLDVFFTIHDPTTLNRQGNDVGTQYRSAIFYHSPEQKAAAEAKIAEVDQAGTWGKKAVTEVVPATTFYVAENYHQEYFARTGNSNPYCSFVVAPKVAKFRKQYFDRLKR
jgi:peptide-methionine (S)-S-oxide reductase